MQWYFYNKLHWSKQNEVTPFDYAFILRRGTYWSSKVKTVPSLARRCFKNNYPGKNFINCSPKKHFSEIIFKSRQQFLRRFLPFHIVIWWKRTFCLLTNQNGLEKLDRGSPVKLFWNLVSSHWDEVFPAVMATIILHETIPWRSYQLLLWISIDFCSVA